MKRMSEKPGTLARRWNFGWRSAAGTKRVGNLLPQTRLLEEVWEDDDERYRPGIALIL
jgi:hypothetical protein